MHEPVVPQGHQDGGEEAGGEVLGVGHLGELHRHRLRRGGQHEEGSQRVVDPGRDAQRAHAGWFVPGVALAGEGHAAAASMRPRRRFTCFSITLKIASTKMPISRIRIIVAYMPV